MKDEESLSTVFSNFQPNGAAIGVAIMTLLGGEHSITRGAIEALVKKYPDLILVQLDAHAD